MSSTCCVSACKSIVKNSSLEREILGSHFERSYWIQCYQRFALLQKFSQMEICCPGAMVLLERTRQLVTRFYVISEYNKKLIDYNYNMTPQSNTYQNDFKFQSHICVNWDRRYVERYPGRRRLKTSYRDFLYQAGVPG